MCWATVHCGAIFGKVLRLSASVMEQASTSGAAGGAELDNGEPMLAEADAGDDMQERCALSCSPALLPWSTGWRCALHARRVVKRLHHGGVSEQRCSHTGHACAWSGACACWSSAWRGAASSACA